jgi:hypothetical protein
MKKSQLILSFLVLLFSNLVGQNNNLLEFENIIDHFVLASHNNLSFQNGKNVFIQKPKDDQDALKKGFKLTHIDSEQEGGWKILAAKDVQIEQEKFRAVLYSYQDKKYIVLYRKDKNRKYYFRIYNSTYH